jgi:hypothetical protein
MSVRIRPAAWSAKTLAAACPMAQAWGLSPMRSIRPSLSRARATASVLPQLRDLAVPCQGRLSSNGKAASRTAAARISGV